MFFHPILSATMVGLLSLATTTSAVTFPTGPLGTVYTKTHFQGVPENLVAGCNNLGTVLSKNVLSYKLVLKPNVYQSVCAFYDTKGCVRPDPKDDPQHDGVFVIGYGNSEEEMQTFELNRILSIKCHWMEIK